MWFENSFVVMDDCKTVIGVDAKSKQFLIIEDLTYEVISSVIWIKKEIVELNTILYMPDFDTLLVGSDKKDLVQIQEDSRGSWKVTKDFGDLGIFEIYSSAHIGNLVVLGGNCDCISGFYTN